MVVLDATVLLLLMQPQAAVPRGDDGKPIEGAAARAAYLVAQLDAAGTKIIIPTPALSEVLVRAGARVADIVAAIERSAIAEIRSFDLLAAVEVAMMTREALDAGDKRAGSIASWAKVKYDRQIVAIAKVAGANIVYSDDVDLRAIASQAGIRVIGIAELPLPPEDAQLALSLPTAVPPEDGPDDGNDPSPRSDR